MMNKANLQYLSFKTIFIGGIAICTGLAWAVWFFQGKVEREFRGELDVVVTSWFGYYAASVWEGSEKLCQSELPVRRDDLSKLFCISDKGTKRALLMLPQEIITFSPSQVGAESWVEAAAVNSSVFFCDSEGASTYTKRRNKIVQFVGEQQLLPGGDLYEVANKMRTVNISGLTTRAKDEIESLNVLPNVISLTLNINLNEQVLDALSTLTQLRILDLRYEDDLTSILPVLEFGHLEKLIVSSQFKGQINEAPFEIQYWVDEYADISQ